MAILTDELSFAYGAVTVGGSSEYYMPAGYYSYRHGNQEIEFSCDVLVRGGTTTEYETKLDELLTELQKRDQALTLTINSRTILPANGETLINEHASAVKRGGEGDTGLSSVYRITIRAERQGTQYSGRRDAETRITVRYQDSRLREVTLGVEYTSSGATASVAQYQAQIATFASTVQSALSVTAWKIVRENIDRDDQDNVARAQVTYREQHSKETSSSLNDSRLRNLTLRIRRNVSGPGDYLPAGQNVERLISVNVYVEAGIDVTSTTDEDAIWQLIEDGAVQEVRSAFGGLSRVALVTSEPELDWVNNRIRGKLFLLVAGGSDVVEQSFRRQWIDDKPDNVVSVVDESGYGGVRQRAPGRIMLTETLRRRLVGGGDGSGGSAAFDSLGDLLGSAGEHSAFSRPGLPSWTLIIPGQGEGGDQLFPGMSRVEMRESFSESPELLGILASGQTLGAKDETRTRTWRLYNEIVVISPSHEVPAGGGGRGPRLSPGDSGSSGEEQTVVDS